MIKAKQKQNIPEGLRPYDSHGLDFDNYEGKEAISDCPLCGAEGKFTVDIESSQWQCFVCSSNGNQYTFIEMLWQAAREVTQDYKKLSLERGIKESTLETWGVVRSPITNKWLVPSFNVDGQVRQLHRWSKPKNGDKHRLYATPNLNLQLYGTNLFNKENKVVFICEGPWDGMKLWEMLSGYRQHKEKYIRTKQKSLSLIESCNVLAVPGCNTFKESWGELLAGKNVYLIYDNDHPRKHNITGKTIDGPALAGLKKASGVLRNTPDFLGYYKWGGQDYNPDLPDGYDVRDLCKEKEYGPSQFYDQLEAVPDEWKVKQTEEIKIRPRKCQSWTELRNLWRKALRWGEGLDDALAVMLACIATTDIPDDQLWIRVIGPPSCGKTTLCEAVSVARKYVYPKDTLTGLMSGYQADKEGDKNYSPVVKINGKTMAIKDADTLLKAPNREQILSEMRALYDRALRSEFKNKMSANHEDINTTLILCGTSALYSLDDSELGERFLDCVIMDGIDSFFEDEILSTIVKKHLKGNRNKKTAKSQEEVAAMSATGGYVNHLREVAKEEFSRLQENFDEDLAYLVSRFGKFIAFMRSKPSRTQKRTVEREMAARLTKQLLRLTTALGVVLNKDVVDRDVMKRVAKVANNTAKGPSYDVCQVLLEEGSLDAKNVGLSINIAAADARATLRHLGKLGAIEPALKGKYQAKNQREWKLTEEMKTIMKSIKDW